MSQYYFVLKACTKNVPVLLEAHPSPVPAFYYKACTKHVSIILCATKLAQSTSQYCYYFVLQSLHKARPSTTLCTAKLAQSTSPYLCATKLAKSMRNCSSKTGSRRQSGITTILKHLFIRKRKRKIITAAIEKRCCQSTIHTSHAATTMWLTTPSCKTRLPSDSKSWRCQKRSFRAMLPPNSKSRRCEL